jgi:hypothetical protein
MSVALKGNLADFGVAEIFQLIGHQRKTGFLEVTGAKGSTRVAFEGGALVWAIPVGAVEFAGLADFLTRCGLVSADQIKQKLRESSASARPLPDLLEAEGIAEGDEIAAISELMTGETLFSLMAQVGGSFEFIAGSVEHASPPEGTLVAEQVLMDGMRMQDEWQTFAGGLPGESDVLEILSPVDEYCARLEDGARGGTDRVRLIAHFVDGESTFREVIDRSRLGTFVAGRILADLRRAGVVEVLDPIFRSRRKGRKRGSGRALAAVKYALAAILPLLLLAGVSAQIFSQSLAAQPTGQRSILQDPLAEARAQFGRQRLHNLLEARRYATGLWPHELNFLLQSGWGEAGGLTPESASAYYYMRRGDGVVLLAPRR